MTTFNLADFGIDRLNRDERIALASAILNSVLETPPLEELSPALRAELDRRIDAYEQNHTAVLPWVDVKAELEGEFRK